MFVVRTTGVVSDVAIVKATDPAFGEAAAVAVAHWTFQPATLNGLPVNCRLMVPLAFSTSANGG